MYLEHKRTGHIYMNLKSLFNSTLEASHIQKDNCSISASTTNVPCKHIETIQNIEDRFEGKDRQV